ncbi:MAG: hypothetical protein ACI97A_001346 [Planctomycetota bacterium]|jgi:hypothetical protein
MTSKILSIIVASVFSATLLFGQSNREEAKPQVIRVILSSCKLKAERPPSLRALFSSKVNINRRGFFELDGNPIWIFLPDRWSHTIENSEKSSDSFENDSSYFYLNQRKDKVLTENEAWFCDTPFRVGDKMFQVAAIDRGGEWIEIRPIESPLTGIVVGRKLPPFSWASMSGQVITEKTHLGKYLVIDVWSPT